MIIIPNMQKALRNLRLLRYQFFFSGWMPENVILILYFGHVLNSYTLAGVVFMLRYWSIALFEIPTGIISDKIGRRRSLILSAIISLAVKLCYIMAFWIHPLIMLLISSVLYGISESINSGTDDAIVYENVRRVKNKIGFADYYGKIKAHQTMGVGASALLGGAIASVFSMYTVMWIAFAGTIARLYYSCRLDDVGFTPTHRHVFNQFWCSLRDIWYDGKLRTLFIAEILDRSGSRGQGDMMPMYLGTLIPYWGMGLWRFSGRIFNAISFWFVKRFVTRWGFKHSFMYSVISGPTAIFIGTLFNNILTPFIFLGDYALRGIADTLIPQIKQNNFTNTQRATMESVYSMAGNICAGIAVLIIGIIAQHTNAMIAIWAALGIKFISFPFYLNVLNQKQSKNIV